MVINVSYFTRSTLVRFFVVISMRVLSRARKFWLVVCIAFLSYLALDSASVASRVHSNWIPKTPTYTRKYLYESFGIFSVETNSQITHLKNEIFNLHILFMWIIQKKRTNESRAMKRKKVPKSINKMADEVCRGSLRIDTNFDVVSLTNIHYSNLSGEGVEELNQVESLVADGHESCPDDTVQRCSGFLKQLLQPHLDVTLCHHRFHTVDRFSFSRGKRKDLVVNLRKKIEKVLTQLLILLATPVVSSFIFFIAFSFV